MLCLPPSGDLHGIEEFPSKDTPFFRLLPFGGDAGVLLVQKGFGERTPPESRTGRDRSSDPDSYRDFYTHADSHRDLDSDSAPYRESGELRSECPESVSLFFGGSDIECDPLRDGH